MSSIDRNAFANPLAHALRDDVAQRATHVRQMQYDLSPFPSLVRS